MVICKIRYITKDIKNPEQTVHVPSMCFKTNTESGATVNKVQLVEFLKPTNSIKRIIIEYPNLLGGNNKEEISNPNFSR